MAFDVPTGFVEQQAGLCLDWIRKETGVGGGYATANDFLSMNATADHQTNNPQPGDIIGFESWLNPGSTSSAGHVGIYIGGGQMISSLKPGVSTISNVSDFGANPIFLSASSFGLTGIPADLAKFTTAPYTSAAPGITIPANSVGAIIKTPSGSTTTTSAPGNPSNPGNAGQPTQLDFWDSLKRVGIQVLLIIIGLVILVVALGIVFRQPIERSAEVAAA